MAKLKRRGIRHGHAVQPASGPRRVLLFALMGLLLAAVLVVIFGRENVVLASWVHVATWLLVFPACLVACLAVLTSGQAAQRTPRGWWGVWPLALPGAAMLAYLPVLVAAALADLANRTPFAEPALLVSQDGPGSKRGCARSVKIRRAGDEIRLCASRIALDAGIAEGSPVRLVGRSGFLGIAIDAVRKE